VPECLGKPAHQTDQIGNILFFPFIKDRLAHPTAQMLCPWFAGYWSRLQDVPGIFPPDAIKTTVNGKDVEELHSDGGSSAQFFTLPEHLLVASNNYARGQNLHIYVIVNNALMPEFSMARARALPIMGRAYAILLKSQTKQGLIALCNFAQRSRIDLEIASIDAQLPYSMADPFNASYMRSVYLIGYRNTLNQRLWSKRSIFKPPSVVSNSR